MNSDQNTRTIRDEEQSLKRARGGVSPTTQAGAEQTAAQNRRTEREDNGPMSSPESISGDQSASRRADAAARRGEPSSAASPAERSPKQENL